MTKTEANQLLDLLKQGAIILPQTVNEALAATGDLAPRLPDVPAVKLEKK